MNWATPQRRTPEELQVHIDAIKIYTCDECGHAQAFSFMPVPEHTEAACDMCGPMIGAAPRPFTLYVADADE